MKKNQFFERTDKIALFLLVVCLGFRDIYPSIGKDVYVFLALIFAIPVILLIRDLLCKRLTTKYFVGVLSVVLFYILIIPFNGNGAKYFLPLFIAGVAFRYTDFRYISGVFSLIQIIVLIIRVVLVDSNMIIVESWSTSKIEDGVSYDLGYGNANILGNVILFLCFYLYLFLYDKNKWISFFIILYILIVSFNYTLCRTALFMGILLLFMYFVPYKILRRYIYTKLFLALIPILMFVVFYSSIYLLSNYPMLDLYLSGRLWCWSRLLISFNSLLSFIVGLPVDFRYLDFPIDNAFAYMITCGGFLFFILFVFLFYEIVKCKDCISVYIITLFVVIFLSGLSESLWSKFGFIGASFSWIILFNKSYINKNGNEYRSSCICCNSSL